ncbi:hypothetical protein [uncultured Methanobrevibacter sp.]|uniref:hypothetical protein n=1 Tax=uncultured Methanobrevibacter sp. TaxID=253161 RepID=UPI0025F76CE4|nr:hypothetical protein [uncultured Methanobrevibacter sp.]
MENKSNYSQFPSRFDVEDEIFIICMSETEEFPKYITNFNDIVGRYDNRLISLDYKNLSLDSVRQRLNGDLINIEHHSFINSRLMRRDYQYSVILHSNSGKYVHPFIFYTGALPIKKVDYLNDLMFFNPNWFITKEVEGNIRLNNILYKINENIKLNVFDCFDLIWLPKFNTNMEFEECILKCISLLKDIPMDNKLRYIVEKSYLLWMGKYVKDENKLEKARKCFTMSELKLRPFEEQFRDALMVNRFERGIDIGKKEGIDIGKRQGAAETEKKLIPALLKFKSPEEISKDYDIPLERVLKYVEKSK